MMAAAAAWDELAAELATAARGYNSVITELTSAPWVGPASRSMLAAVTPYVSWLSTMAAQAEETASQARAAAAAYETAFTVTVPPPVIAANRVLLMTLIATNFFGQNTPAIVATEAQYMEMWAQDAAAMYGYAASVGDGHRRCRRSATAQHHHPRRAAGDQAAAVAQASATPAGNSAQTVAATIPQLLVGGAAGAAARWRRRRRPPTRVGLTTIEDFLTYGLAHPDQQLARARPRPLHRGPQTDHAGLLRRWV